MVTAAAAPREMLENIREMSAFPATPQMRQAPVGEFFRKLEETSGDRLPTWNGAVPGVAPRHLYDAKPQ